MTLLPASAVRLLTVVTTAVTVALVPLPVLGATEAASYVAIGDSFTAGPGIPIQGLDRAGCFHSNNNYPHVLRGLAG